MKINNCLISKEILSTIHETLTPDDIRVLIETEDEYDRKGNFRRVFPSKVRTNYLKYFETPRYHNILLTKWMQYYIDNRDEGFRNLFI